MTTYHPNGVVVAPDWRRAVWVRTGSATALQGVTGELVRARAGLLLAVIVALETTELADRWIHLFDATAAPAAGDRPLATVYCPGAEQAGRDWSRYPLRFERGLWVVASTTAATLTLTGQGANALVEVCYADESECDV